MFNFKENPHKIFLMSAVLLTLFSVVIGGDDLDIILHDEYFVIRHSFILISCLLFFFWGVYSIFSYMFPSRRFVMLHVWGTLLPMLLIIVLPTFLSKSNSFMSFSKPGYITIMWILFLFFCLGQASFLINFAKGITSRLTKKSS